MHSALCCFPVVVVVLVQQLTKWKMTWGTCIFFVCCSKQEFVVEAVTKSNFCWCLTLDWTKLRVNTVPRCPPDHLWIWRSEHEKRHWSYMLDLATPFRIFRLAALLFDTFHVLLTRFPLQPFLTLQCFNSFHWYTICLNRNPIRTSKLKLIWLRLSSSWSCGVMALDFFFSKLTFLCNNSNAIPSWRLQKVEHPNAKYYVL